MPEKRGKTGDRARASSHQDGRENQGLSRHLAARASDQDPVYASPRRSAEAVCCVKRRTHESLEQMELVVFK